MKIHKGFTLIELMVVLAVAAVLMTVALPSFLAVIQNNKSITQANELVAAINLARSEAIKRGRSVFICASSDQATCIATYANTSWPSGWIVVEDTDASGTYTTADDTNVLRVWDAMATGTSLTNDTSETIIRYRSTGLTDLAAELTFTMKVADCKNNNGRLIKINTTGRIHSEKTAC